MCRRIGVAEGGIRWGNTAVRASACIPCSQNLPLERNAEVGASNPFRKRVPRSFAYESSMPSTQSLLVLLPSSSSPALLSDLHYCNSTMATGFEFVIHPSDGNAGTSKADKIRIRRQAMKAVGISRRQRGNYGQYNLRQYPVYIDSRQQTIDTYNDPPKAVQEIAWINTIPAQLSSKGFELMKIEYGVDILDLSGLITIHVGRAAARILSSDRALLVRLLRCKQQWSYLSYLPSRYGYNACLDDAMHCVTAKMRQIIFSTDQQPSSMVLSLYGKALKSLQAAVNDPVSCLEPNVLCATEILALFEVC